jgi:hypothetical protein
MPKAPPDPRIGTFTVSMDRTLPRTTRIYMRHLPNVRGTFVTHQTMMTDDFVEWRAEFEAQCRGSCTVYLQIEVKKVGLKYEEDQTGYLFVFEHATDTLMFASEWAGK